MGNSIAQGLFSAIIQLQPLPWDDSPEQGPLPARPIVGRLHTSKTDIHFYRAMGGSAGQHPF